MVALVAKTVVYGALATVLGVFHEDTLGGDSGQIHAVLAQLLNSPVLAEDFFSRVSHDLIYSFLIGGFERVD